MMGVAGRWFGPVSAVIGWLLLPVTVAAAPSIVVDDQTGVILAGEAIDQPWPPASLTKLMTLYVAFGEIAGGRLDLAEVLVTSAHAAAAPPTELGLGPGDRIPVSVALQALPVVSANDAAVLIAERIAGSEAAFAQRMTAEAHRLGMMHSRFGTATGLPRPDSETTARDMSLLARALRRDYPDLSAAIFGTNHLDYDGTRYATVNGFLVSYPGADGMKTGFTCAAGYNVVASAERGGKRLIAVVLGRPDRARRMADVTALMNQGFAGALRFDDAQATAVIPTVGAVGNPDCPAWSSDEPAVATRIPSGRSVSLGVFPTLDKARLQMRRARAVLTGPLDAGLPSFIPDRLPGKRIAYRAVLGGLDPRRAFVICTALRQARLYCTIETPERLRRQARQ